MTYKNIDLLDARIEKIISQTVKSYYSDWKHYDRPKYMKCKGSSNKADRQLVLIARKCGTYLVKVKDLKDGNEWANAIYDYYTNQEPANYYYIDLDSLFITKITDPKTMKQITINHCAA